MNETFPAAISKKSDRDNMDATNLAIHTTSVTYQPTTPFDIYALGVYGADCTLTAYTWMWNHGDMKVFSQADILCACLGTCLPPLKPNPAAVAGYAAWVQHQLNMNAWNALKANAVILAFTIAVVLFGLVGQ